MHGILLISTYLDTHDGVIANIDDKLYYDTERREKERIVFNYTFNYTFISRIFFVI